MGFYGSLVLREMLGDAYAAGARRAPYGMAQMARTWRGLLLEFGPSELLDAALVRPLAMGIGRQMFGWGWGVVAGKIARRPGVLRTGHMDSRAKTARRVGTIGYQASTVDSFLAALGAAHIELVVDVRAVASSRRPGFSKSRLAASLAEAGIGYVHLRGLGTPATGRAAARAGRFPELRRIYQRHLATLEAKAELAELVELVQHGTARLPPLLRARSRALPPDHGGRGAGRASPDQGGAPESNAMKIALGCDHAGYRYKQILKAALAERGHAVTDFGTHSTEAVDYPLFIRPVAEAVAAGELRARHRSRRLGQRRGDRGQPGARRAVQPVLERRIRPACPAAQRRERALIG